MIARRSALPVLALGLLAAGCDSGRPTAATQGGVKKAAPPTKDYKLVGVVRRVDRESGEVAIRHEAIPGFMPAMTMPFDVKDKELLSELRAGDEVEGTLRVSGDHSELVALEVTKPAVALAGPPPGPAPRPPLAVGEEVPDFSMRTQDGEVLRLSDLRGKVVALTFIYTRCPVPDFCPLMDRKFAELAERVKALPGWPARVRLLSVSFDPEHDTPEVLARHARLKGAAPPLWTFAVASHDELRKVAGPLGLAYGPAGGEVIHNLVAAVVGPDGKLAWSATGRAGKAWQPAEAVRAMKPLVGQSRQ
jgi:protein SCO1